MMPKPRVVISVSDPKTLELLRGYKDEYGFSFAKTIDLAVKGLLPQLKPNQGGKRK